MYNNIVNIPDNQNKIREFLEILQNKDLHNFRKIAYLNMYIFSVFPNNIEMSFHTYYRKMIIAKNKIFGNIQQILLPIIDLEYIVCIDIETLELIVVDTKLDLCLSNSIQKILSYMKLSTNYYFVCANKKISLQMDIYRNITFNYVDNIFPCFPLTKSNEKYLKKLRWKMRRNAFLVAYRKNNCSSFHIFKFIALFL